MINRINAMLQYSISLTFFLITIVFLTDAKKDYYWRDYDGSIPEDAFIGGQDVEGKNVYIGQVYISREGLLPVQINPGIKSVYAEIKGVKYSDKNIKILCSWSQNLAWLQAQSSSLQLNLINKDPVIGGHEDGWGTYLVGKINAKTNTCIGKVLESGIDGRSLFYCVNKMGHYLAADDYEVLVNSNEKEKN